MRVRINVLAAIISMVSRVNPESNRSNKFALSSADVGAGLKESASALAAANNTMEQSASMLTAITEITQDSASAGNALKTNFMSLCTEMCV